MCACALLSVGCYYHFVHNFWGCSCRDQFTVQKNYTDHICLV